MRINLIEYLLETKDRWPNKTAVIDENGNISYQHLYQHVCLNNPGQNTSPVRRMEITNPFCWKSRFR